MRDAENESLPHRGPAENTSSVCHHTPKPKVCLVGPDTEACRGTMFTRAPQGRAGGQSALARKHQPSTMALQACKRSQGTLCSGRGFLTARA